MIISGTRQPGNDIDVFVEPLMEDMKILWEDGILVFFHCQGRSKVSQVA
jgi:hypothetical protein